MVYIAEAPPDPALKPHSSYLAHLLAARDLLPPSHWECLNGIETADTTPAP